MFKTLKKAALLLLACLPAYAGDLVINTFGGMNSFDPSAALQPYESPDLLNVNLQPGMKSVYKRDGYGLFQTLGFSTAPVHGGYHFQQTGGGDVQLWGQATKLVSIVNDAASVVIATGTDTATWQCTDNLGFAYCLTTSNDTAVKTDGTAANTTYQDGTIPKGTMITSSPSRLIVGAVSGSGSTLNFSASNNFTSFTVGPLNSDPFTVIVNAPGSRLTHIAYYFGKLFWWKDQSFGFVTFTNQYDYVVTTVSNQIGTLDNSSAFWNGTSYSGQVNNPGNLEGGIYFRGQDNHIYTYDGYQLNRLTRQITPSVATATRKKANSWTQTSQADFQTGASSPSVPVSAISFTASAGAVTPDSFTITETGNASGWGSGTASNLAVGTSSLTLTMADANIANNSFETGSITNWTLTGASQDSAGTGVNCTLTPRTGSKMLGLDAASTGAGYTVTASLRDCTSGSDYTSINMTEVDNSCPWTARTLSSSAARGHRVKVHFAANALAETADSDCFINSGTDMTFYTASEFMRNSVPTLRAFVIDDITSGSDTITTGSLISQVYNLGMPYGTVSASATWSANTSTPTFVIEKSANGTSGWTTLTTSTGINVATDRQYVRYATTITVTSADSALTAITGVNIVAESSGTYLSAVNNAPNLTSWGTLTQTDTTVGNSTVTYYVRASTGSFTVQSSTPVWTLQNKNSNPSYSTGTYMQLRADFAVTAATENPSLQDFTFNWNEGNASDKAYITYFQDAIWVSVSSGTGGTNNRIFYLDLLNNFQWLLYDITANGFLVENNNLYFGDPTAGRVFKFGGVPTDNGAAITSYWKSKDFTGDDPTKQNQFVQSDFIFNQANSTATYTYVLDQNTSTAVSIPLTSSTSSILRRGFLLPPGKLGYYYNFKVGDTSSNPKWTLLMHRVHYDALNWFPKTAN